MNVRPFLAQSRMDTPLGPLTAAATSMGIAGLWFDDQRHHPGPLAAPRDDRLPVFEQVREQLDGYFAGARRPFTVALDPFGTPFQQAVWKALLGIAAGRSCSYGDIARQLARPDAARAVGAAVGRNPVGIVIPCHRVIGSNGSLTGYAGGLDRKRALLTLEAATVSSFALAA